MSGSGKQICRIETKQCGINKLEQADQQRCGPLDTQTHTFGNVMQMCDAEEQRSDKDRRERWKTLQYKGHHAGTEDKLLAQRRHHMVTYPDDVVERA